MPEGSEWCLWANAIMLADDRWLPTTTRSGSICAKWECHFPSLSLSTFGMSGFFCFSLFRQFRWQFLVDLWSREENLPTPLFYSSKTCQSWPRYFPYPGFLIPSPRSSVWRASPIILMFVLPYLPPLLGGDGVLTVMSWRPIQTLSASRPRRPTFSYWHLLFFIYAMNIHSLCKLYSFLLKDAKTECKSSWKTILNLVLFVRDKWYKKSIFLSLLSRNGPGFAEITLRVRYFFSVPLTKERTVFQARLDLTKPSKVCNTHYTVI